MKGPKRWYHLVRRSWRRVVYFISRSKTTSLSRGADAGQPSGLEETPASQGLLHRDEACTPFLYPFENRAAPADPFP